MKESTNHKWYEMKDSEHNSDETEIPKNYITGGLREEGGDQ